MYQRLSQNSVPIPQNHLYKVLYISIGFSILLSAYSTAQGLMSHIYKELGYSNLGRICIFTLYINFAIGSIFTSYLKRKFSAVSGLVFGSLTYLSFMLTGTFTTFCSKHKPDTFLCESVSIYILNILFASFIGFGASILWMAQSSYVNDCTNETNKGTYHGIFLSLMTLSMIIGGTMAAFVLGSTDEFVFYLVLSFMAIVSVVMFAFMPPINTVKVETVTEQKPVMDAIIAFFECYKRPRNYPIIIASFTSGHIISFYATYFPTVVRETISSENPKIVNQMISFALIGLGFGQLIAGYGTGRLFDRFPNVKLSEYIFGITELSAMTSFLAMVTHNYLISLLSGFLWGISDNSVKTLCIGTISAKFKGSLELFAAYRGTQCVGIVVNSLVTILFSEQVGSIFVIAMLLIEIGCHIGFNYTFKNIEEGETEAGRELLQRKTSI